MDAEQPVMSSLWFRPCTILCSHRFYPMRRSFDASPLPQAFLTHSPSLRMTESWPHFSHPFSRYHAKLTVGLLLYRLDTPQYLPLPVPGVVTSAYYELYHGS